MDSDETVEAPADETPTPRSRRDYILIIVAAAFFLLVPLIVAGWALTR